ncbi:MAG: hypothetical protein U0R49_06750 [Fimbriimonadales bacterium]
MGKAESGFSTFLVWCIVGFFAGLALTTLSFFLPVRIFMGRESNMMLILGASLTTISALVLMVGFIVFYTGHKVAKRQSSSGPPRKVACKVHSAWRTHKGRVIGPEEIVDDPIQYHVVLITEDNKRLECDTHYSQFAHLMEGSWGYAEIQGEWLGNFTVDPDLYTKHTARR